MSKRLKVGDAAPAATGLDVAGNEVDLSIHWSNGPTLLTFLRHFG